MSKTLKITLIVVASLLVIVVGAVTYLHFNGFKGQPIDEIDIHENGESETIEDSQKDINTCTANECLYLANGKLNNYDYYVATIKGEVTALGGIYKQTVDNYKIKKGGVFFAQTKSTSSFVQVGTQVYYKDDNTLIMREATNVKKDKWSDNLSTFTLNEYLNIYGVDSKQMTNYILNENSIISGEFVKSENGLYTYKYTLDTEKATAGYRVNIAKMGDMNTLPSFSSCELEMTITSDFTLVSLTCKDVYKVEKMGGLTCTSTLHTTFEHINDNGIQIENENIFLN